MIAFLSITLGVVLGWCARIVYSDLRERRRSRETDRAVLAFFKQEDRVVSGVREMQR